MQTAVTRKLAQKGFTLIELIITIVIIGVLAAVAIPKFLNLSGDAEKGVAGGIAGALASATSVNYGKSKVPGAAAGTDYQAIYTCTGTSNSVAAVASTIADIPSDYIVVNGSDTTADLVAVGTTAQGTATGPCGIAKTGTTTVLATFKAYGAGTRAAAAP